jgi:hypothetical protein
MDRKTKEDFMVITATVVATVVFIYMVKTLMVLPGLP